MAYKETQVDDRKWIVYTSDDDHNIDDFLIPDYSVTADKLAPNSVTSQKIVDGAITAQKISSMPTMSATVQGGARLGSGLEVTDDVLSVDLMDEGSGESVTAGDASYLAGLTIDGKAVQDGTPTPSTPVPIEVVGPNSDSEFGIKINDTLYSINLQSNVLASLSDGTKDVLIIDSAGHVVIEKRTNYIVKPTVWAIASASGNQYFTVKLDSLGPGVNSSANHKVILCSHGISALNASSPGNTYVTGAGLTFVFVVASNTFASAEEAQTWVNENNFTFCYDLATPQTIDLGYIDMPAIPDGAEISIVAQVTPTIQASWWKRAAAAISNTLATLRDDLLARIEAIEEAIADL